MTPGTPGIHAYPALLADILDIGIVLPVLIVLVILGVITFVVKQYKRCPSNRILVVYGKVGGSQAARCVHGGGVFIVPLFQDYQYMSLEPMAIDIELTGALSKKNIRVNVPSTFTVGISTDPAIMTNAAERLLGLREQAVAAQARDIILGQMRLVIATLTIEQINQDREVFLDLVNKNVGFELNKIGLDVINVNIRDIMDESGYIEALGRKAAADAVNQAKIEVAEALRQGAIGEASANREKEVEVANQTAAAAIGRKNAERETRIKVAQFEASGLAGEASSAREQEVAIAQQKALAAQGKKQAEADQRIKISELEAAAVEGENTAKANMAAYNATLAEREAEAKRRGEVARAMAARDVLKAEAEQELALLQKEQVVQQSVEKEKITIDAEAEAERIRRTAKGEADAILAKYNAEAEGIQRVLTAKARGYEELLKICGSRPDLTPTLLMIEKLPELVREQVKAISNLKIDKVTVWDSGNGRNGHGDGTGEGGTTAGFLRSLISSLPPMHELAKQAGVELPGVLGTVGGSGEKKSAGPARERSEPQPEPADVRKSKDDGGRKA
ncbi:MAG: SPFH domain-containing protein [Phycisphaeraceae bacterium]